MNKKIVALGCLVIVFLLVKTVDALNSEPGSMADPVVTKSYVKEQLAEFKEDLLDDLEDLDLESLKTETNKNEEDETEKTDEEKDINLVEDTRDMFKFKAFLVKEGKKLIGMESTEIILRSGKATAITSEAGGLQNMTNGTDIGFDKEVPLYNLIIIPRTDGRGMIMQQDSWVMVRGLYEVVD